MYLTLIAEIILAVFAVFGIYAMIRLFVTSCLSSSRVSVAIEIREGTEPEDLASLLEEARERMPFCGRCRLVALIEPRMCENTTLLKALEQEGVKCYFLEKDKK